MVERRTVGVLLGMLMVEVRIVGLLVGVLMIITGGALVPTRWGRITDGLEIITCCLGRTIVVRTRRRVRLVMTFPVAVGVLTWILGVCSTVPLLVVRI